MANDNNQTGYDRARTKPEMTVLISDELTVDAALAAQELDKTIQRTIEARRRQRISPAKASEIRRRLSAAVMQLTAEITAVSREGQRPGGNRRRGRGNSNGRPIEVKRADSAAPKPNSTKLAATNSAPAPATLSEREKARVAAATEVKSVIKKKPVAKKRTTKKKASAKAKATATA